MILYDWEERDKVIIIVVVFFEGLWVLCFEDEDFGCVLWFFVGFLFMDNIW